MGKDDIEGNKANHNNGDIGMAYVGPLKLPIMFIRKIADLRNGHITVDLGLDRL
jgi:hypothetical protein